MSMLCVNTVELSQFNKLPNAKKSCNVFTTFVKTFHYYSVKLVVNTWLNHNFWTSQMFLVLSLMLLCWSILQVIFIVCLPHYPVYTVNHMTTSHIVCMLLCIDFISPLFMLIETYVISLNKYLWFLASQTLPTCLHPVFECKIKAQT